MSEPFRAYRIHRDNDAIGGRLEEITIDDLAPGPVIVRVEYSGINYKDALAATGTGRILKRFPLVGGIDLAGEVVESSDARFVPGQKVLALGGGLSETRDGGYAELARLDGDLLVRVPDGLDTRAVMALGTAGFTAALAVHRLEHDGLERGRGPVIVTGATGGVGSFAIDILNARGHEVVALTGKTAETAYLERLGASRILDRHTLEMGTRPLEHADWAGAVDNLGGPVLAWLMRTTLPRGSIASVGLTAGAELHATVMPFILRGVSVLGICMDVAPELRSDIWQRLTSDLRPPHLEAVAHREVALDALPACFADYLDATVVGRTIVRVA